MDNVQKTTIVGAGPVGSLLSVFLARQGMEVEVFERRPDMRRESISAGRSINLAMSLRGLHALEQIGASREALREAVPMRGRMMHAVSGELTFQPYGKDDSECIYSISRGGLNSLLMTAAERTGRVSIRFNQRVTRYDSSARRLELENGKTGERHEVEIFRLIGTDGSASVVREEVMRVARLSGGSSPSLSEHALDYGYKELRLPPRADGGHQLEKHALHIWPRGKFMLIALPNFDGSYTCTLFLPFEGPPGEATFAALSTPGQARGFFSEFFPDILRLLPQLEGEFFGNPTGRMVTVKCAPWHIDGQALLVGDAAHAIVPFFGQGMNCGFEDCAILDGLLSSGSPREERGWETLFERFGRDRKPDSDAIADLAVENFVEMRDRVGDPRFLLEKQVERILQREFPGRYVPRYSLVTFSRKPYREALQAGLVHAAILGELCRGIRSADELDLTLARELVDRHLPPHRS